MKPFVVFGAIFLLSGEALCARESANSFLVGIYDRLIADAGANFYAPNPIEGVEGAYAPHFSRHRLPADLLKDDELRVAFRAAYILVFYSRVYSQQPYPEYLGDARERFGALQRRGIASESDCADMFSLLVDARLFDQARELKAVCPSLSNRTVPVLDTAVSFDPAAPAHLVLDEQSDTFHLQNVDLDVPVQIVATGGTCEFSRDALKVVLAEPAFRDAFIKGNAIWMEKDQAGLDPDFVRQWNRDMWPFTLSAVYHLPSWPDIDFSSSPGFYYFRDGELVAQHHGWSEGIHMDFTWALGKLGLLGDPP